MTDIPIHEPDAEPESPEENESTLTEPEDSEGSASTPSSEASIASESSESPESNVSTEETSEKPESAELSQEAPATSEPPDLGEEPDPKPTSEEPESSAEEPSIGSPAVQEEPEALLPAHASPNVQTSSTEKHPHILKPLIILIIILAAVAVAAFYLNKHDDQLRTNTKKDIPYLTYAFSDSRDVTPSYPVEGADTNSTIFVDSQIMEGLTKYTSQTKVAPLLATSWENPDSSTWIFNLRQNVKFHSGRTMTATDVKYSLDYAVAHQNNDGGATDLYLANSIKQVDIINPYQVKITTNGPDAVLLNRLTALFILDSKAKLSDPNAGTGPYIVKPGTVKPNATTLDLVAYDKYWGGHVYTRAVHFVEEPTIDAMAADAAKGKLDISGDYDSQQTALIKSKASFYKPFILTDVGVSYITLNTANKNSPLYSLAARQAVQSALNTQSILKAGSLTGTPANQIIPPSLPGYDPSIKTVPYDPVKAKQLLTSVPKLSTALTFSFPTGDEGQVDEIAKELEAVGFHIKLNAVANLGTLVNELINGQGDIFYLSYDSNTLDGLDMINNVVLGNTDYINPAITTLANQAGNTLDPATRIAILQKIEQQIAKDVPTVALYSQTRTYAVTKPHIVFTPELPSIDASVYFWQVYQQ